MDFIYRGRKGLHSPKFMKYSHYFGRDLIEITWRMGGFGLFLVAIILIIGLFFLVLAAMVMVSSRDTESFFALFFGIIFSLIGTLTTFSRWGLVIDAKELVLERWWGLIVPFKRTEQDISMVESVTIGEEVMVGQPVYLILINTEQEAIYLHSRANYGEAIKPAKRIARLLRVEHRDDIPHFQDTVASLSGNFETGMAKVETLSYGLGIAGRLAGLLWCIVGLWGIISFFEWSLTLFFLVFFLTPGLIMLFFTKGITVDFSSDNIVHWWGLGVPFQKKFHKLTEFNAVIVTKYWSEPSSGD